MPAEALLEAEPDDWWTIGRRVRLGRAVEAQLADRDAFMFGALAPPYERLATAVDGRAIFSSGVLAGDPVWAEVPVPLADNWSPSDLHYSATFDAAGTPLVATGHDGGDVDWFTVDGDGRGASRTVPAPVNRQVIPGRLDYPGAPNPRWWQLEDRSIDIGGFTPDRAHFATMLLLDIALAHADDWFAFPVPPPASLDGPAAPSSGVLVSLADVTVRDSFGQTWDLAPPPAEDWSLFHTTGLDVSELLIWPVAVAPQSGPVLDDVLIGVDEDANLAWAVELRADGLQLLDDAATEDAIAETTHTGTRNFRYLPSTTLPNHWHPYQRVGGGGKSGRWRQAVLADLTGPEPVPRPGPVSQLIGGPSGAGLGRGHELISTAIASNGLRLQRRAMLSRDVNGRPVLWVERSAHPVAGPPTSHLRFDVLAEDA